MYSFYYAKPNTPTHRGYNCMSLQDLDYPDYSNDIQCYLACAARSMIRSLLAESSISCISLNVHEISAKFAILEVRPYYVFSPSYFEFRQCHTGLFFQLLELRAAMVSCMANLEQLVGLYKCWCPFIFEGMNIPKAASF